MTAIVAGGRLWLSHGEISGLAGMDVGLTLAVLCLGVAPGVGEESAAREPSSFLSYASTLALLYGIGLSSTVQLGFTRAHELNAMFWADIPLLLGGALSLGCLLNAGLARISSPRSVLAGLPALLCGALMALWTGRSVLHRWIFAELLGLGVVAFGLLIGLSRSGASRPGWLPQDGLPPGGERDPGAMDRRDRNDNGASLDRVPGPDGAGGPVLGPGVTPGPGGMPLDGGVAAGLMMLILCCLLAFGSLSGYGLGILVLGTWYAAAGTLLLAASGEERTEPAYGLSFAATLLIHRLLLLQSGSEIRTSGPADTWDLFAICLGVMLPLAMAAWVTSGGAGYRSAGWAGVLEWLVALASPAILVGYVLGGRAVAGVLLGVAVASLVAGVFPLGRRMFGPVVVSGLGTSLVLLEFLPWLRQLNTPTEPIRMRIILACTLVVGLRMLVRAVRLSLRKGGQS